MGRKPYVSKIIGEDIVMSKVRLFDNGGAYIPVPKKYAGKTVKIIFEK